MAPDPIPEALTPAEPGGTRTSRLGARRRWARVPRPGVRPVLLVTGVGLVALGTGIGGYALVGETDGEVTASAATPASSSSTSTRPSTTTTSTTTIPPTTTTTVPPIVQPPGMVLPPLPGGALRSGNRGPEVQAYEERLAQLHFDPGPLDGVFDSKTTYAVQTVDKIIGAPRDGIITPAVQEALQNWQYVPGIPDGEANRAEINLDLQVLTVYAGGQVTLITTTSTGNGSHYCGGTDGCQYAVTPVGKYKFEWNYRGWHKSKLGQLYNPYYFNGGIAVHGYTSVPTKPASHGCARIPMHIAEYFAILVQKDEPIYVHGTEAPKGGFSGGGGSSRATPPATPPPTTPPETAPPETAPPETAPPDTTSPGTAPPVTTPTATDPPVTVPAATSPPTTPVTEPPATSPPTTPVTDPPAPEGP